MKNSGEMSVMDIWITERILLDLTIANTTQLG